MEGDEHRAAPAPPGLKIPLLARARRVPLGHLCPTQAPSMTPHMLGEAKPQSHDVFELSWCLRDPMQELLRVEDNPLPAVSVLVTPSLLLGDTGAPHLCHPNVTFHCRTVKSHLLFRHTNGAGGKTKPQWMARAGDHQHLTGVAFIGLYLISCTFAWATLNN